MLEIKTYPVTETKNFTSIAYLEKPCPKGRFCWRKNKEQNVIMKCTSYRSNGLKEFCKDE